MCGIVGVFELKTASQDLRLQVLEMSKKIRHRGPDWSGIYCGEKPSWLMSGFQSLIRNQAASL